MLIKLNRFLCPFIRLHYQKMASSVKLSTAVPKENTIKVRNWDINYLIVGNGPHTVLLAPGALGTIWTDFKPQVEGFNREKFTVVAWDPPGYGKSRPPVRDFPVDFYEKDADYTYEFMKALNISKYSLLGWSDGGIVSMIHAAKYPEAVQKLVVWGTNSLILPHELELYKKYTCTRTASTTSIFATRKISTGAFKISYYYLPRNRSRNECSKNVVEGNARNTIFDSVTLFGLVRR
ncbi:valacyclovir hydrolase-like isoform X2 [Cydia fagiglandana]|uniref:valacyclovir hydrolase-like isoform X2 n=1 Tax=Cydia fagiglandana TaxID=1458189 RepID=UPI002FEE20CD